MRHPGFKYKKSQNKVVTKRRKCYLQTECEGLWTPRLQEGELIPFPFDCSMKKVIVQNIVHVRKEVEVFCSEFLCVFGGTDLDPENEGFGVWLLFMMKKFKIVKFLKGFLRKGLWTKKVPTNVKKIQGKYQGYWDTIGIVIKEIRLSVENLLPRKIWRIFKGLDLSLDFGLFQRKSKKIKFFFQR